MQSEWLCVDHSLTCAGTPKQRKRTSVVKRIWVYKVTFFPPSFFLLKQVNRLRIQSSLYPPICPSIHASIHSSTQLLISLSFQQLHNVFSKLGIWEDREINNQKESMVKTHLEVQTNETERTIILHILCWKQLLRLIQRITGALESLNVTQKKWHLNWPLKRERKIGETGIPHGGKTNF